MAVTRRTMRLAAIALAVLLVVAGVVLRQTLGLEISPDGLRRRVDAMGALAPALFVVVVALRFVILVPSAVLLTVGGACFGAALGTLYGALGLTLMGLLQFALVQLAGAEALRARVPARFAETLRAARTWRGAATLAVVSAYPVGPQTAAQVAAALAGMSLATFVASVGSGAMLRAGLFAWFGSALLDGEGALVAAGLIAALVALPFLHPRSRRTVSGWLAGGPSEGAP